MSVYVCVSVRWWGGPGVGKICASRLLYIS